MNPRFSPALTALAYGGALALGTGADLAAAAAPISGIAPSLAHPAPELIRYADDLRTLAFPETFALDYSHAALTTLPDGTEALVAYEDAFRAVDYRVRLTDGTAAEYPDAGAYLDAVASGALSIDRIAVDGPAISFAVERIVTDPATGEVTSAIEGFANVTVVDPARPNPKVTIIDDVTRQYTLAELTGGAVSDDEYTTTSLQMDPTTGKYFLPHGFTYGTAYTLMVSRTDVWQVCDGVLQDDSQQPASTTSSLPSLSFDPDSPEAGAASASALDPAVYPETLVYPDVTVIDTTFVGPADYTDSTLIAPPGDFTDLPDYTDLTVIEPNCSTFVDSGLIPFQIVALPPASVGDTVWEDLDRDGVQDDGEPGIPGVELTLLDAEGNPAVDIAGNPVPPVRTDAAGRYEFIGLRPDAAYTVVISTPDGFTPTVEVAGGDREADSSTGRASSVILSAGGADLSLDFGFVREDAPSNEPTGDPAGTPAPAATDSADPLATTGGLSGSAVAVGAAGLAALGTGALARARARRTRA